MEKELKEEFYKEDSEYKNEYLLLSDKAASQKIVRTILKKIDEKETDCGKRILDWDLSDVEDYLQRVNSKSKVSLNNYLRKANDYAVFLNNKIGNRKTLSSFESAYKTIQDDYIDAFLSKTKVDNSLLTWQQYLEIINDDELNIFARATIVLLWSGIAYKISDFYGIKKSQLFEKGVITNDGNKINITDEEYDIIQEFIKTQETKKSNIYLQYTEISNMVEDKQDERIFYFIPTSDEIYHGCFGSYFQMENGKDKTYFNSSPKIKSFSRNGYFKELLQPMYDKYYLDGMLANDVIKSGAYYRVVVQLDLLEQFKKEPNMEFLKKYKRAMREMLAPYVLYQQKELVSILEKMEKED